ncbi:hypothetical protein [Variovorax sp. KK3]|uniref:hypothetical protein n=1 Tax=Variovorax sp. KK3 TaxID=1855728 RepID=UPI002117964C|nr:hypothetical protein [Variovorax sp. KK3]
MAASLWWQQPHEAGNDCDLIVIVVNQFAKSELRLIAYMGSAAAIVDLLGAQVSSASGPPCCPLRAKQEARRHPR